MAVKQLTDGWPDGYNLGQSANDKVAAYGVTPIVQRTSTQLATSLLSASTYCTVGSNLANILTEFSNTLVAFGVNRTA